jgi:hypothetical protein
LQPNLSIAKLDSTASAEPVFADQCLNHGEFPLVGCDRGCAEKKIVRAEDFALFFKAAGDSKGETSIEARIASTMTQAQVKTLEVFVGRLKS